MRMDILVSCDLEENHRSESLVEYAKYIDVFRRCFGETLSLLILHLIGCTIAEKDIQPL